MPTNRKEHLRYRYGICLNDSCSKCKSKEVQQIPARKEFVCEECQKALRECPPPKSFWDKYGKLIIGIIVLIAIIATIVVIKINRKSDSTVEIVNETESTEVVEPINSELKDTITAAVEKPSVDTLTEVINEKVADTPLPSVSKQEAKSKIQVPFGVYTGPENGLDGEIKVTRNYTLDLRNAAHESIELLPGDVITRTKFKNGELVGGYWHRGSESRSFHR